MSRFPKGHPERGELRTRRDAGMAWVVFLALAALRFSGLVHPCFYEFVVSSDIFLGEWVHDGDLSREAWGDLFDRYHTDLAFTAHDHEYERSHPMSNGSVAGSAQDGTIYLVTAGAGAPVRKQETNNDWSALFVKVNHFVLVTINGNRLIMEARRFDQTVFDTLQITKAGPAP